MVYEYYPDAISHVCDAGNYTALHWACSGTFISVEVIKFLVEKYPTALHLKSWGNRTCLHHACENSVAVEVVDFLLQQCPSHVRERDNHQSIPLHLACGNPQSSYAVVKLLTEMDPTSIEVTSQLGLMESRTGILYRGGSIYSGMGYTALHYACGEGAPLDVVRLLVQLYPSALRLHGSAMALPLHLACSRMFPSLDIISYLVSMYPKALEMSTSDSCTYSSGGGTPGQLVTKSRPSLKVVRFLYDLYPATFDEPDSNGQYLALQYACSNGASPEVIEFLLERINQKNPCRTITSKNGATLLHYTCYNKTSHSLVPVILERFPESVHIASNNGDLPLHAACQGRAPLHLIRLLLRSSPGAIQTPNNDGNLPLHILVKRKPNFLEKMIDLNVLHYLVDQYPEALSMKNQQQNRPFDLAVSFLFPGQAPSPYTSYQSDTSFDQEMKGDAPIEILRSLIPREPKYQQKSDHVNEHRISLPLHYALSHLPRPAACQTFHDCQHKHQPHSTQTIINFLLERDPKACCNVNELGETALHVACRSACYSLETVEFLFTKNPQAVEVANSDGLYPFLVAATRKDGYDDDHRDLNSLELIYFLVHRSLFAFKHLVPTSYNVRRVPCNQPNHGTVQGDKVSTSCQNDLKELLRQQQEKYDHRFLDLERQIQELKERQHEQEMSTKSNDSIDFSSCCIIS